MSIKTKKFDLEKDLAWSSPKRVRTKNGERDLCVADATEDFWAAWKAVKADLKARGISCGKNRDTGDWEVLWWKPLSQEVLEGKKEALEASRAVDADVEIPAPEGCSYMGYQKAGVAYGVTRKHVLIGDEMGLGKTIQAVGIANAIQAKRILVICPASLRLNWRKELEKWLVEPLTIWVVDGGGKKALPSADAGEVVICNYDVVGKHGGILRSVDWDLLVIDECHYLKSPKAKRTQEILGGSIDRKAKVTHNGIHAERTAFLTGTPLLNRPNELWTLASRLDPEGLGKNWWSYHTRYCNLRRNRFGIDISGASNLPELQEILRERFMIRRLSKDVLDLGAIRRQVIELPVNGGSKAVKDETKAYAAHQELLSELRYAVEIAKTSDNREDYNQAVEELKEGYKAAFSEMAKCRKETALAKVEAVCEHVATAVENGPVVLFAHHKDVVAQYEMDFQSRGLRTGKITGDVPLAKRQQVVDDFQAGEIDVFIGNIQAAGVGITLTRSHHVVFAELPWTPAEVSQAEKRCHRIGSDKSLPVLVQHLVLEGSIDAHMASTIVAKQAVLDAALDDPKVIEELSVPVLPDDQPSTVEYTPSQIDKDSEKLTMNEAVAIHEAIQRIAGTCDGAVSEDGRGFNKFDSRFGKQLAAQGSLSKRQAVVARKMVQKYQRQLSVELVEACGIVPKKGG